MFHLSKFPSAALLSIAVATATTHSFALQAENLSCAKHIVNPDFKVFEFEHFKKEAGLHTFTPSISEWIDKTNAIGLYAKKGRYGGTYAHKDIAFEFCIRY